VKTRGNSNISRWQQRLEIFRNEQERMTSSTEDIVDLNNKSSTSLNHKSTTSLNNKSAASLTSDLNTSSDYIEVEVFTDDEMYEVSIDGEDEDEDGESIDDDEFEIDDDNGDTSYAVNTAGVLKMIRKDDHIGVDTTGVQVQDEEIEFEEAVDESTEFEEEILEDDEDDTAITPIITNSQDSANVVNDITGNTNDTQTTELKKSTTTAQANENGGFSPKLINQENSVAKSKKKKSSLFFKQHSKDIPQMDTLKEDQAENKLNTLDADVPDIDTSSMQQPKLGNDDATTTSEPIDNLTKQNPTSIYHPKQQSYNDMSNFNTVSSPVVVNHVTFANDVNRSTIETPNKPTDDSFENNNPINTTMDTTIDESFDEQVNDDDNNNNKHINNNHVENIASGYSDASFFDDDMAYSGNTIPQVDLSQYMKDDVEMDNHRDDAQEESGTFGINNKQTQETNTESMLSSKIQGKPIDESATTIETTPGGWFSSPKSTLLDNPIVSPIAAQGTNDFIPSDENISNVKSPIESSTMSSGTVVQQSPMELNTELLANVSQMLESEPVQTSKNQNQDDDDMDHSSIDGARDNVRNSHPIDFDDIVSHSNVYNEYNIKETQPTTDETIDRNNVVDMNNIILHGNNDNPLNGINDTNSLHSGAPTDEGLYERDVVEPVSSEKNRNKEVSVVRSKKDNNTKRKIDQDNDDTHRTTNKINDSIDDDVIDDDMAAMEEGKKNKRNGKKRDIKPKQESKSNNSLKNRTRPIFNISRPLLYIIIGCLIGIALAVVLFIVFQSPGNNNTPTVPPPVLPVSVLQLPFS
jgi:hypothetical protein